MAVADYIEPPIRTHPKRWDMVVHPLAACFWFVLALTTPLLLGYLGSEQRYIFDWYLLFYAICVLLGSAWVMNAVLMPVAGRSCLFALLGIVSLTSVLSDISEQGAYWGNYLYNTSYLQPIGYAIVLIVFLVLLRFYLGKLPHLRDAGVSRYTLFIALPFILLLAYHFLSSNNFYAQPAGRYPVFHQGLLPLMPNAEHIQTIEGFFTIDNPNQ